MTIDKSAGNLRGLMWMLLSGILISGMHGSIRYVSTSIHPFEIAFFRLLFGLLPLLPWLARLGWAPLKTNRFGLLALRGALNVFCMLAFFYSLSIAPLVEVTTLAFSAPIFATIAAMIIYKEKIGLRRWVAIAIGFLGVLVVLRPGFQEISEGQILALSAAVGWSACMVMIKSLGRTETSLTITLYMSLVMAPLALIPALWFWEWPTEDQLIWLMAIGVLGGAGQMAMAEALKVGDTHVVMPVEFTRLIWISVIAYVVFAELPGLYTWIGGGIIFLATAFIAWRERVAAITVSPPTAIF
jgi:drug/metabolite transporter (DMT)-like permease